LFVVREECATVGGRDSDVIIKSLNKKKKFNKKK